MVLAKDFFGVTLAVKSHPEASVENELPGSLTARVDSSRLELDEETKNYD
jgi:hypothetical protein